MIGKQKSSVNKQLALAATLATMIPCGGVAEAAPVEFVNNTGAPVTDFHFTELAPNPGLAIFPNSVPWGAPTHTFDGIDTYEVSYSGPAIAAGLSLFINSGLTNNASHVFSNFTWTPGGQTAVASVPEPATWVALIMGFGMMGALSRRSRGRSSLALRYANS
jgi:hypothetical protein